MHPNFVSAKPSLRHAGRIINLKKTFPLLREVGPSTMKNAKKQQARQMYLHGNLSKTEIAHRLKVDRKTIYLWVREGAWDRLRRSSQHIPALIAEQCYFIMGHLTGHILSDMRSNLPATPREADAIHKLALSIKKLKNRCTVNESMELFTHFLGHLRRRSPHLANVILPYIEEFIDARSDVYMSDFLPDGFNEQGHIPGPFPVDLTEQQLDGQNQACINNYYNNRTQPATSGASK